MQADQERHASTPSGGTSVTNETTGEDRAWTNEPTGLFVGGGSFNAHMQTIPENTQMFVRDIHGICQSCDAAGPCIQCLWVEHDRNRIWLNYVSCWHCSGGDEPESELP